jgi:hypothetical protein
VHLTVDFTDKDADNSASYRRTTTCADCVQAVADQHELDSTNTSVLLATVGLVSQPVVSSVSSTTRLCLWTGANSDGQNGFSTWLTSRTSHYAQQPIAAKLGTGRTSPKTNSFVLAFCVVSSLNVIDSYAAKYGRI